MIRFLILFFGIPLAALGQSKSDYNIYSLLINKQIVDWKMNMDTISQLVVSNSLTKFSQSLTGMIDEITANDNSFAYTLLHFYNKKVDLLKNNEFKQLVNDLKLKLDSPTDLKADSFILRIPVKIEIKQRIEKIFNAKTAKGFDKAWQKFYRNYPTSPGYFEFSKVAYSKNFAVVYVVHRAKPLIGSGGLVILIKENGSWENLAYYGMWNN